MDKPMLVVMCGLQCSGKSTKVKELENHFKILSSDKIRKKYPDWTNENVFKYIYSEMNKYLSSGENVMIDATNITIKSRRQVFLNLKVDCYKLCYVMNTPYNECRRRLLVRNAEIYCTNYVPEQVLERYYHSFEIPFYEEGWDEIVIDNKIDYEKSKENLEKLLKLADGFDQQNKHHTQDLGTHLKTVGDNISNDKPILKYAGYYHDVGKLFTQTFKPNDLNAHYYNHANVGTYNLLCSTGLYNIESNDKFEVIYEYSVEDTLEWLFYINYHMHMYNLKTDKAINKWKNIFKEDKFNNLILLNNADSNSHKGEENE